MQAASMKGTTVGNVDEPGGSNSEISELYHAAADGVSRHSSQNSQYYTSA